FPLTPALSLGERENRFQSPQRTERCICRTRIEESRETRLLFPLLGGEGQGEGELDTTCICVMKTESLSNGIPEPDCEELNYDELVERVDYDFGLSRRSFVQVLGAGLLITASVPALAQQRRGGRGGGMGGGGARNLAARIHI